MPRPRLFQATIILLSATAVACSSGSGGANSAPAPAEHSLSGIAAQHVAVLPTYVVRVDAFPTPIDRPADIERQMDADIVAAMEERGLKRNWIFPERLAQTARRNSTYATDPYAFAEEPLRAPSLPYDRPLPEPLASQIRTLVAFEQDVRLVLAPVELRLEKAGTGGRGVLHLVLIDARTSQPQWIGDIPGDTVSAYGPKVTASIAARLAAVIAPR